MAIFTCKVIETREYSVSYEVEAETAEEAVEKAEQGDTVDERGARHTSVLHRAVQTTIPKEDI